MIKRFYTPLLLGLLFVFASCSKNDVTSSEQDLIGTWQVTGISSERPFDWDGDGYTETDIISTYSFCQRDIQLSFENGGYGQSRQGCNDYWQNMYWQLSNRTLTIDLPGDDLNLNLIQFTQNTIRGEDYVYVNGQNFVITYVLSRR